MSPNDRDNELCVIASCRGPSGRWQEHMSEGPEGSKLDSWSRQRAGVFCAIKST